MPFAEVEAIWVVLGAPTYVIFKRLPSDCVVTGILPMDGGYIRSDSARGRCRGGLLQRSAGVLRLILGDWTALLGP